MILKFEKTNPIGSILFLVLKVIYLLNFIFFRLVTKIINISPKSFYHLVDVIMINCLIDMGNYKYHSLINILETLNMTKINLI